MGKKSLVSFTTENQKKKKITIISKKIFSIGENAELELTWVLAADHFCIPRNAKASPARHSWPRARQLPRLVETCKCVTAPT